MSNMEAFNKIMSEIGEQLNEETITAIKAALEAKDEPVGDNKVKQLVNQCTHRDIDGNWYVDGVQLVHATCDAIIKGTI